VSGQALVFGRTLYTLTLSFAVLESAKCTNNNSSASPSVSCQALVLVQACHTNTILESEKCTNGNSSAGLCVWPSIGVCCTDGGLFPHRACGHFHLRRLFHGSGMEQAVCLLYVLCVCVQAVCLQAVCCACVCRLCVCFMCCVGVCRCCTCQPFPHRVCWRLCLREVSFKLCFNLETCPK